jgi:hypothetical protein
MTTIATLQVRYRELGRLRMGQRVPTRNGGRRPEKLETWRFTSTDWRLIQRASQLYGGKPERWDDAPSGTRQFQVVTDADAVPVILPPDIAISQAMEAWTTAGCVRRCDGQVEYLSGAECLCADEGDQGPCKPTTRLSVMLPDMPGLGVWRVETRGWFAARELVPMVRMAATLGRNQTYRLRIDPRHMDSRDDAGKPQTFHFGVPVLDTDLTPAQLLELAEPQRLGIEGGHGPSEALTAKMMSDPPSRPTPPARDQGGSDPTSEGRGAQRRAHIAGEASPSDPTSGTGATGASSQPVPDQTSEEGKPGRPAPPSRSVAQPPSSDDPSPPDQKGKLVGRGATSGVGSRHAPVGTSGDDVPAGSPTPDLLSPSDPADVQKADAAERGDATSTPESSASASSGSSEQPFLTSGESEGLNDSGVGTFPVEEWAIRQDPPVDLRVAKVALRKQFKTDFGWLKDWRDLQELQGEQAVNAITALEAIYLDPGEGKP